MKEVKAYVGIHMLDKVIHGLEEAGFTDMVIDDLRCIRRGLHSEDLQYSVELAEQYMNVAMVVLVVHDSDVAAVTGIIPQYARTGVKGDGLIYVSGVETAIRIHSGARDEQALEPPPAVSVEAMRSLLFVLAVTLSGGIADRATAEALRLTPEQIDRLGIRVERLEQGSAGATLARPTTVAFDLDRIARVGPRISAKVISVSRDLGASVKKGDVLAVLSSVELGLAETRYRAAKARLATEKKNYARERGLYEQKISSEADMLEARARYEGAEAKLDAAHDTLGLYGLSEEEIEHLHEGNWHTLSRLHLTSHIDGVVDRRDLAPGDTVRPNDTPIHVVDASRLWVMIDAFEQDALYVAPG